MALGIAVTLVSAGTLTQLGSLFASDDALPADQVVTSVGFDLDRRHGLTYLDRSGRVVQTGGNNEPLVTSDLSCTRIAATRGTGVCLRAGDGTTDQVDVTVVGEGLHHRYRAALPGRPFQAHVLPSGRWAFWTVLTGQASLRNAIADPAFGAVTQAYDTATGKLVESLEAFAFEDARSAVVMR